MYYLYSPPHTTTAEDGRTFEVPRRALYQSRRGAKRYRANMDCANTGLVLKTFKSLCGAVAERYGLYDYCGEWFDIYDENGKVDFAEEDKKYRETEKANFKKMLRKSMDAVITEFENSISPDHPYIWFDRHETGRYVEEVKDTADSLLRSGNQPIEYVHRIPREKVLKMIMNSCLVDFMYQSYIDIYGELPKEYKDGK